jgi:hypothetical protein
LGEGQSDGEMSTRATAPEHQGDRKGRPYPTRMHAHPGRVGATLAVALVFIRMGILVSPGAVALVIV